MDSNTYRNRSEIIRKLVQLQRRIIRTEDRLAEILRIGDRKSAEKIDKKWEKLVQESDALIEQLR